MPVRSRLLFCCAFAAAAFLPGCEPDGGNALRISGRIEGTFHNAGSLAGGRVLAVHVDEGDAVRKDQALVSLDARMAKARLDAAEAQVAQARATLAKLEFGATAEQRDQVRAAQRAAEARYDLLEEGPRPEERSQVAAQVSAAAAQLEAARAQRDRVRDLHKQLATSKQQVDQADAAYAAALAQHKTATEQLAIVTRGARDEELRAAGAQRDQAAAAVSELEVGVRKEDLDGARAAVAAATAQADSARIQLDEAEVISPAEGVVTSVDVSEGDLVQPGPLVRVLSNESLTLVVYVTAARLGTLKLGQRLNVTADSHGDKPFSGIIDFIASEGTFTPRNLQTEEERAQQVFEVHLRLEDPDGVLHPGMSATAHLPRGDGST